MQLCASRTCRLLVWSVLLAAAPSLRAASCESLVGLKLADTTITSAVPIAAGQFMPPSTPGIWIPYYKDLPEFCRVVAQIRPTKDSEIGIEVWLPTADWNHRYQGVGGGGFAGNISYGLLAIALHRGFATASTDTGHKSAIPTDARWALGHPEKTVDFAWRAIHEMTVKAKAITEAFYGEAPKLSYFSGCSTGGRQALIEAQRFPADYDGILAGAPANYWTHLLIAAEWDTQATEADPASYIPRSKLPVLATAAMKACDATDGVTDGIINDPRECRFDPATIQCKAGDSDSCLTAPQVAAISKIYSGPRNSKGEQINPGFSVGTEPGLGVWVAGSAPGTALQVAFAKNFFAYMAFENPDWNFRSFNFDRDVKLTDDKLGALLNADNPNLKEFKARGGKLIQYHGWADPAIPAMGSIKYYEDIAATMGAQQTASFMRLYMAPGMDHCAGGAGPEGFGQAWDFSTPEDAQHNLSIALQQWVEQGIAPATIIARKPANPRAPVGANAMTRPLCPYPQVAKYKESGDTNDAANFACVESKK